MIRILARQHPSAAPGSPRGHTTPYRKTGWRYQVWPNPPEGSATGLWLARLAAHGDGIVLIFCTHRDPSVFNEVRNKSDGVLFLPGRLHFHHVSGERAAANAGAPSALVAYGRVNVRCLHAVASLGQVIDLASQPELRLIEERRAVPQQAMLP